MTSRLHSAFWEEDEAPELRRLRFRQRAAYGAAVALGKNPPPPTSRRPYVSPELPPPAPLTTVPDVVAGNAQAIISEVLRYYGLRPRDVQRRGGTWATACVREMAYRLATYGRSATGAMLTITQIAKLLHRHPDSIRTSVEGHRRRLLKEDAGA